MKKHFVLMSIAAFSILISGCGGSKAQSQNQIVQLEPTVFPLKISTNGRYLVGQDNKPFLIHGDSPQALIVNVSESDADFFMANRTALGFNSLWINILSETRTGGRADGSTYDGIIPFSVPGDLSTPNENYFRRVDAVIRLAADHGQLVFIDPIETKGWLPVLRSNGVDKARAYGRFIGNRYRSFDNIIWLNGNAFQTWPDPNDDAVVRAVALGIKDVDSRHLHTSELNFNASGSLDDETWRPILGLNGSFTYYPTYAQVLKDYNRPNFLPTFLVEANYEWEAEGNNPLVIRQQAYWAMTSGAAGQLFGNHYIWLFLDGWKNALNTTGAKNMTYLKNLLKDRAWHNLVPDQDHKVITGGLSQFADNGSIVDNKYLTAAATSDGTLAIAYVPNIRTITVDMSNFSTSCRIQWFDPTNAQYTVARSSTPNSGVLTLTPPGPNSDGAEDWVLVIETI